MALRERAVFAGLLLILSTPAFPAPAPATLGPFTRVETISGVKVTMVTRVELAAAEDGDASGVNARLVVDLSDLQAKIGPIVATFPLPRNNCNVVARVSRSTLGYKGDGVARLVLNGSADAYTCVPNPLTGKTLTRTKIGSRGFTATIPFTLAKDSDRSVKLVVGQSDVDVQQGTIASLAGAIFGVVGIAFQQPAYNVFSRVIDPKLLLLNLPPELDPFQPVITSAAFAEENGKLAASIQLTAKVPAITLPDLFGKLTGH